MGGGERRWLWRNASRLSNSQSRRRLHYDNGRLSRTDRVRVKRKIPESDDATRAGDAYVNVPEWMSPQLKEFLGQQSRNGHRLRSERSINRRVSI